MQVLVRKFGGEKWTKPKIKKNVGNVIYLVELQSGVAWKRHTNHTKEIEFEDEENKIIK